MNASDIAIYGGIMLIVVAAVVFGLGNTNVTNAGGDPEYKVMCSGNVDVALLGLFNEPELDPEPTCTIKECNPFTLSISPLFLGETGTVRLVVDGKVVATEGFDTALSNDAQFTLSSSCITNPSKATVELYNDKNKLVDSWSASVK